MIEVSSEQSRSQFCIHTHCAAGAAAAALCVVITVFFSFCYVDTVCGFTTEYLDLIDYNYYTVRCCTTYEYVFVCTCLLLCSALLYCCCCSCCCCSSSCAGCKFCSRGSLHPIPVFDFSSFKRDLVSMYPLAVLSHFQRRFFNL